MSQQTPEAEALLKQRRADFEKTFATKEGKRVLANLLKVFGDSPTSQFSVPGDQQRGRQEVLLYIIKNSAGL